MFGYSGYTCAFCLMFVPQGKWHHCRTEPSPPLAEPAPVVADDRRSRERIAHLERQVETLSRDLETLRYELKRDRG